jgi:hypothetical protein
MRQKKVPGESALLCPNCGQGVEGDDAFCTGCGAALRVDDETAAADVLSVGVKAAPIETVEVPAFSEVAAQDADARQQQSRSRRWMLPTFVSVSIALALLALGGLGYAWHSERTKHHTAARDLDRADQQIADLSAAKARLSAQLASEQEIAARRAAVLKRADRVLQGVEPLLSSVDELKSITVDMQSQRDAFASDSAVLVDDLIELGRYLLAPGVNNYDYVNGLISEINSELSIVRSDQDSLTSADSSYSSASDRFDTRATRLTKSVRALEKQLKVVTK